MARPSSDPLVIHLTAVAFTAQKLLLPQLRYLRDHGYQVRIACAPDQSGYPEELEQFEPLDIRFPRALRPMQVMKATRRLVKSLRAIQPDVLHLHTPAAALPVRMIPRRLFPKDMKIFYTVHGYAHTWSDSPRDRVLQTLEKALSPRADITFFQSREDLDKAKQHGFRGDLRYLGNGVQSDWFNVPKPERRGDLKLLYSGRLVREKGVLELAAAVTACDGVELAIAGAQLSSDRDGVESEVRSIAASSDGKIQVLGMLDFRQLVDVLSESDAVVLPSHREGVPRSLIEGMAAARPAIATKIRGCRELVTDGQNGILVDPESTQQLITAITQLRDLPVGAYDDWSQAARAAMSEQFREDIIFERLADGYREALQPASGVGSSPFGNEPRVLHVAAVSFTLEKLLLGQLRFLESQGFYVRVACAPDADGFPEGLRRYKPIDVRFPRSVHPLQLLHAMYRLSRTVWDIRPDIVHLHTPAAALPARLIPRFLWPRGTRLCYTVHGYAHSWSDSRRDRMLQVIERVLTPRADLVLFVSKEDLDQARSHGYSGRLQYLGNGVSDEWFAMPLPQRNGNLKLAYNGRVVEEKGISQLVQAVSKVQGVELLVAGAQLESDRDGVEELIRSAAAQEGNLGRIHILGMLDQAELRQQMLLADVIVLPSYREGLPLSLIEGMAAGRPAIATDVRGCRELVTVGLNGILVKPRSVEEILEAIEALRDMPHDEFFAMALAAREEMAKGYREIDVLRRLLSGYEALGVSPGLRGSRVAKVELSRVSSE